MIAKKKDFKGVIPFGPFLAVGTYLWILFDMQIMNSFRIIFENLKQ